jgi:hypothetical protein
MVPRTSIFVVRKSTFLISEPAICHNMCALLLFSENVIKSSFFHGMYNHYSVLGLHRTYLPLYQETNPRSVCKMTINWINFVNGEHESHFQF